MSRDQDLIKMRNTSICKRYKELAAKTVPVKKELVGKVIPQQLYRHDAICEMMSTEFWITADWIERIVRSERNEPEDPTQYDLFKPDDKK